MTDLEMLAARAGATAGPDRELDADIWEAMGLAPSPLVPAGKSRLGEWEREPHDSRHSGGNYHMADMSAWGRNVSAPAYTASLDAAMTLVPDRYQRDIMFSISPTSVDMGGKDWKCAIGGMRNRGNGRSFALALTAAALRAHLIKDQAS